MLNPEIITSSLLSYGVEEWAMQNFIAGGKVALMVFNVGDKVAMKEVGAMTMWCAKLMEKTTWS